MQLNRLQKSTFDNDRIYYRCRVMRLEHEQLLDAYSASLAHPEEAGTIDRGMLYMHLGLDKIEAMQSMAKSESTTQQITQIFESTSELIVADQVADGGDVEAAADMRWVDECLRRVEVHRTVCSDDWQRTEEDDDTVGGASTVRRLAETEAKLVVLIERSHLHTKVGPAVYAKSARMSSHTSVLLVPHRPGAFIARTFKPCPARGTPAVRGRRHTAE